mmetsp:Transcript_37944/g.114583  ORF Transcript_37944/g.114583 Transcript_37944/m.114583 type:complete len:340 (-) Transcript_37944:21-1040(-)
MARPVPLDRARSTCEVAYDISGEWAPPFPSLPRCVEAPCCRLHRIKLRWKKRGRRVCTKQKAKPRPCGGGTVARPRPPCALSASRLKRGCQAGGGPRAGPRSAEAQLSRPGRTHSRYLGDNSVTYCSALVRAICSHSALSLLPLLRPALTIPNAVTVARLAIPCLHAISPLASPAARLSAGLAFVAALKAPLFSGGRCSSPTIGPAPPRPPAARSSASTLSSRACWRRHSPPTATCQPPLLPPRSRANSPRTRRRSCAARGGRSNQPPPQPAARRLRAISSPPPRRPVQKMRCCPVSTAPRRARGDTLGTPRRRLRAPSGPADTPRAADARGSRRHPWR